MGREIYTIGHSSVPMEQFLDTLRRHGITLVVDVRSRPYSRYAPHFNQRSLESHLHLTGIAYRYMGHELGGKPDNPHLHGPDGEPDYDRIERSMLYRRGIDQLLPLTDRQKVALLCSEADPRQCHREKLLARTLRRQDVRVIHIFGDGSLGEQLQGALL